MDEIKKILYVILEAEAINAAEINELRQEQKGMQKEMRRLVEQQEQILTYVRKADCVKESHSFYVVS